jgi:AcrR family transcriptional regulator
VNEVAAGLGEAGQPDQQSTGRSARDRILEAASDLVAEEGIDSVRIARVATRARTSSALVHHYFSTREELLTDALLRAFDVAAAERFDSEEQPADETATAALAMAIRQCLPETGTAEREWVLWVELWLRAARDPELRPVAARLYRRYRDWIAEIIARGAKRGEFQCDQPERLADHAMALFDGMGLRALIADPEIDVEHAQREIAAILGRELGVEAETLVDRRAARV